MKKILSALLAFAMVFSLTACGSSTSGSSSKGGASSELLGPGKVTLKRLGYNVGFDVNSDYMVPVIKKATGYDVKYSMLPAEQADEKLLMEVSSGNDYDVMNLSVDQWRQLVAKNALMPLDDLLKTYGQDILKGASDKSWKAVTGSDGKIYGVCYMYPYDTECSNSMVVRMDLLKEAGVSKLPETIDEFYDMLVKLKKHFGDKYIVLSGPYTNSSNGANSLKFPTVISSAFGIYNDWMVDDSGKVSYMTQSNQFKDMVDFLAKCSKEGLLDPDWAANTTSTVQEKFASGKSIIACADRNLAQYCIPALEKSLNLTDKDFDFITPLKGKDGTCKYQKTTSIAKISAIPKNSKHAADAMNWMNLKQKNQLFINIGEEGKHFTYDSDHSIKPISPTFANERGDSYYYIDSTNEEEFRNEWPSRVRKSNAQWLMFTNTAINLNKEHPEVFVDNAFAYMPAAENFSKYNTTLLKSLNDYITQIMAGVRSSKDTDAFMNDWKNNGGEKVQKELQDYISTNK